MTQNTSRILSLDVLRGLTIALMILVNSPGSWSYVYPPFRHASWNGVTPTDLVFPLFLFIMGVSLSFSMNRLANNGLTSNIFIKIFKRSLIIFLIGIFLNLIPNFNFTSLRIPGVLQRISLVFLINALLFVSTSRKIQTIISAAILVSYWVLLTFIPFNGQIPIVLTPDNNLSAFIDNIILNGHMWSVTGTWDPEGLLSTLPAIVSTSIGMIAGAYLKKYNFERASLYKILIYGAILITIGLAVHPYFPMNKSLWTSSYVLFTSGIGLLLLVILYTVIDKKHLLPPILYKPFTVFGTNAIVAYVLSGLVAIVFYSVHIGGSLIQVHLFNLLVTLFNNPYLASLIYALSFTTIIYLCVLVLYRKKIFVKI